MATVRRQPDTLRNQIMQEDERRAAVAVVEAYLAELDEAAQDDDEDVYNDIISSGFELDIGEETWQLWFEPQEGWTAAQLTEKPEFEEEDSKAFGDGDLMGLVGGTDLSPEELVRRLATFEFERIDQN
jgi:hypothetical protein